jgi:hypothetical protein
MKVGVLTGTGTYALDEDGAAPEAVTTGTTTLPTTATAPATSKSAERGGCRMSESLQLGRAPDGRVD